MSSTQELLETLQSAKNICWSFQTDEFMKRLDEIAEVVKRDAQIVHCGECKSGYKLSGTRGYSYEKKEGLNCVGSGNRFCSYGKRKEE